MTPRKIGDGFRNSVKSIICHRGLLTANHHNIVVL